ncbi:hypothetical protein WN51_07029 [Melipona quadrifasciata]|uniref:Uncharacterized protein n=1 Tax=Melipona quadrifasciata TaxID=166423 RepID=A0A0M8ZRW7_9HYME|nr:hypothetical protein WN51_07029 [Melipona quadrifasciata]
MSLNSTSTTETNIYSKYNTRSKDIKSDETLIRLDPRYRERQPSSDALSIIRKLYYRRVKLLQDREGRIQQLEGGKYYTWKGKFSKLRELTAKMQRDSGKIFQVSLTLSLEANISSTDWEVRRRAWMLVLLGAQPAELRSNCGTYSPGRPWCLSPGSSREGPVGRRRTLSAESKQTAELVKVQDSGKFLSTEPSRGEFETSLDIHYAKKKKRKENSTRNKKNTLPRLPHVQESLPERRQRIKVLNTENIVEHTVRDAQLVTESRLKDTQFLAQAEAYSISTDEFSSRLQITIYKFCQRRQCLRSHSRWVGEKEKNDRYNLAVHETHDVIVLQTSPILLQTRKCALACTTCIKIAIPRYSARNGTSIPNNHSDSMRMKPIKFQPKKRRKRKRDVHFVQSTSSLLPLRMNRAFNSNPRINQSVKELNLKIPGLRHLGACGVPYTKQRTKKRKIGIDRFNFCQVLPLEEKRTFNQATLQHRGMNRCNGIAIFIPGSIADFEIELKKELHDLCPNTIQKELSIEIKFLNRSLDRALVHLALKHQASALAISLVRTYRPSQNYYFILEKIIKKETFLHFITESDFNGGQSFLNLYRLASTLGCLMKYYEKNSIVTSVSLVHRLRSKCRSQKKMNRGTTSSGSLQFFRGDENLFANFFMLERGTRDYSSALRGVALIFASQPHIIE